MGVNFTTTSVRFTPTSTPIPVYGISIHFVVDGVTNYFDQTYDTSASYNPSTWSSTGSNHLYFLSGDHSSVRQPDSAINLLYFAMYNHTLSAQQISTNYQAGLPKSPAVIYNNTINIQQEGEVGDHSQDPWFYYMSTIPTSQLVIIPFPVYDVDGSITSPNYNPILAAKSKVWIKSNSNSKGCQLYYINGTAIPTLSPWSSSQVLNSPVMINYDKISDSYSIHIRPAFNQYSKTSVTPFCTLSFQFFDGYTNTMSINTAWLSVVVTHVDKPPIPFRNLTGIAYAHQKVILQLTGYDTDSQIRGGYISNLPKNGQLFPVYSNGTISNIAISIPTVTSGSTTKNLGYYIDPQKFIGINSILKSGSQIKIAYLYTGSEIIKNTAKINNNIIGVLNIDSFGFRLVDQEGRYSISANYNLTVYSSVIAVPTGPSGRGSVNTRDTIPLAIENQYSPITIYGQDSIQSKRYLSIQITKLPTKGEIYHFNVNNPLTTTGIITYKPIQVGDFLNGTISPPYTTGLRLMYHSQLNYFSSPYYTVNGSIMNNNLPDSFEFLVIASPTKTIPTATSLTSPSSPLVFSATTVQLVTVKNFNQPTEFSFLSQSVPPLINDKIVIYAYSPWAASEIDRSATATFTGFKLTDPDESVGVIICHIKTQKLGGYITLNQDFVSTVDFRSWANCFSNTRWMCAGRGYEDNELRFAGTPLAVQNVLNSMTYLSVNPFIQDNITVTISDGAGGYCIDDIRQNSKSIRVGCYSRTIVFNITVLDYSSTSMFQFIPVPLA